MNLMNGWVIILIIVLFFAGMYVYAYSSVYFEKKKSRMQWEAKCQLQQQMLEKKQLKKQLRNEKFQKIKRRSDEIKQELRRLEEMRLARLNKQEGLA